MDGLTFSLPQAFQGLTPPPSGGSGESLETNDPQLLRRSSHSRIHTQTKAKAELSLVTAEGDKVSISAKSFARTNFTTYDFLGRKGNNIVSRHTENFQALLRNRLDIKVEGDLNETELADIQALLQDFEALAGDFFSGSLDPEFTNVLASDDLGTIASFDASLKFSQQINIGHRAKERFVQPSSDQDNQIDPDNQPNQPPETPSSSPPVPPAPFPSQVSSQRPLITPESTDQFVGTLVEKALAAQEAHKKQTAQPLESQPAESGLSTEPTSQPDDPLNQLTELLKSVLDQLAEKQDFDPPKQQLAIRVHAQFSQQLKFSFRQTAEADVQPPVPSSTDESETGSSASGVE